MRIKLLIVMHSLASTAVVVLVSSNCLKPIMNLLLEAMHFTVQFYAQKHINAECLAKEKFCSC